MSDVTDWVENAVKSAGGRLDVVELPSADAADVVRRAMSSFVERSPAYWWWERLKLPATRIGVSAGAGFA